MPLPPDKRNSVPCDGTFATQVCSDGHVSHRWTGTGAHDCPHAECGRKYAAVAARRDWDEHFAPLVALGAAVSTVTLTSPEWTWPLLVDVPKLARAQEIAVGRTLRKLCPDVPKGWLIPFDLRLHPTRTRKPGWSPHGHFFIAWIAIDPKSGEWRLIRMSLIREFEARLREEWRRVLSKLVGRNVPGYISVKLTAGSKEPAEVRGKLAAENRRHVGWGHTQIHRHRSCGAFRRWKSLRAKMALAIAPRPERTCKHVGPDGCVCGKPTTLFVEMDRESRARFLDRAVPWERWFHAHDDGGWCGCDAHRRAAELQGWRALREWNEGWRLFFTIRFTNDGRDFFATGA